MMKARKNAMQKKMRTRCIESADTQWGVGRFDISRWADHRGEPLGRTGPSGEFHQWNSSKGQDVIGFLTGEKHFYHQ